MRKKKTWTDHFNILREGTKQGERNTEENEQGKAKPVALKIGNQSRQSKKTKVEFLKNQ